MSNYMNEESMHQRHPVINNNFIHPGLNDGRMDMNGSLPYHFSVEHLASFPQELASSYLTPDAALTKLKNISLEGGLWAQKMNMNITENKVVMANEEQQVIEEYPIELISLCITILDDAMFENLLIFSTKLSKDKVGAVHLFQCKNEQASSICDIINRAREHKQHPQKSRVETRTVQQQSRQVAQVVKAIENHSQVTVKQNVTATQAANGQMTPYQDAKITRDVEILNKCIEEIENFVVMLKRINEARKNLQNKKKKNKKKVENILILQSQPPPDEKVIDICQKFKHALNLLAKLQQHISEPNSPELVHYLFIPLNIIVKVTGIEKARSVVNPLITKVCVNLLNSCLDSREYHFWQSLGPNWTLTKDDEYFRDHHIQPYLPIFVDGWQPPEIITNEKQEAAARSTAAKFARMQGHKTSAEYARSNSMVILAAQKFKNLAKQNHPRKENEINVSSIKPDSPNNRNAETSVDSVDASKKYLVGIVVYDYLAHNNKELTIRAGEKVYIIDNSRRWWLVCNDHGEQGYVPSTVLEIPAADESSSLPERSDGLSPRISPVSYANDTPVQQVNHAVQTSYHSGMPPSPGYNQQNGLASPGYKSQNGLSSPGYNSQNYMNGNAFPPPPSPGNNKYKETKTVTPVVISVQLPDGGRVETNSDGTRIVATPASMVNASKSSNTTTSSYTKKETITQSKTTVIPIQKQSRRTPDNTPSPVTQYQQHPPPPVQSYKRNSRSSVTEEIQTTPPPMFQSMPPPPPPPLPTSATPFSKPTPTTVTSKNVSAVSEPRGGDLQSELRNRLSLQQADEQAPYEQNMSSIDSVDVFIPLYKSSTADDVSRWLYKLGFSNRTIETLKGKTAKDLFKIKKDEMIELLGPDEGVQLYDELQVQNGAKTRHKTMTEFQKALYKRVQKREELQHQAHALHHIPETNGSSTSSTPSNEKDITKGFEESASLIRRQKEELEKLKNTRRAPDNATFSSFSSDVQAKTKL